MDTVCLILNKLRNMVFFSKFKKCYFYKNKTYFLKDILPALKIQIKDKKIKVIKNWPK